MNAPGRVIVVGSTNTDLVVRAGRLPRPGETVLGGDLQTFAGGKGANQAVAAARAGARTRFVAAFGGDDFGRARRAGLRREGVDCSGATVKQDAPSGVALIALAEAPGAKAENLILVAPGANARLTRADVRRGLGALRPGDVVLASMEIPLAAILEAFRRARRAGALTLLNPAPMPPGGLAAGLLALTDALTPNETEFEGLLRAQGAAGTLEEQVQAFLARGCRHVLVTCGARGVRYYRLETDAASGAARLSLTDFPAPEVEAVDTVGAGDCFSGSLAAMLAGAERDFAAAARYAVAAAALKVTRPGAQAGMPRRRDVLKLLRTI